MATEQAIIAYLDGLVFDGATVPAYGDRPDPAPTRCLTVERSGGSDAAPTRLGNPTFTIQCWAETRDTAGRLGQSVERTLVALDGSLTVPDISQLTINSRYNYPDTAGDVPRYQIVADTVTMYVAQD